MINRDHCAYGAKTLNSSGRKLRQLLAQAPLRLPGISDGLSACLVKQAGFAAAYLSGGAFARGAGFPDLGIVTLTELVTRVGTIAEVCDLPFLVVACPIRRVHRIS
jgi:2-methylisocitrate lyase-like PEP mutase family enzyme